MSNTVDLNKLRQMSRNNPAYVGTHNMMEYAIQELETARIEIARLEAECAAMKGSLKKIASASTSKATERSNAIPIQIPDAAPLNRLGWICPLCRCGVSPKAEVCPCSTAR